MFAYVYLAMKNVEYVMGAMVSCPRKTKHDTVLMVTPDIPVWARTAAEKVFTSVILVDLWEHEVYKPRPTKKRAGVKEKFQGASRYDSWVHASFTKWQCASLLQYDKVLFVDADILLLTEELDELFELRAPAATFSSAWARPYDALDVVSVESYLPGLHHAQLINWKSHRYKFKQSGKNYVMANGGLVLLKPKEHWVMIKTAWQRLEVKPYGDKFCKSAVDEQFLCNTLLQCDWSHIDQKYQATPTRNWGVLKMSDARAVHFITKNQWEYERILNWVPPNGENKLLAPSLALWWTRFDALLTPALVKMMYKKAHHNILPHHKNHREHRKTHCNQFDPEFLAKKHTTRKKCTFFGRGFCRRGENCNFLHVK